MSFEKLAWLFSCNNQNRGIIRMNFDEAALLWQAARASAGPILEVGRAHGGSTVLLCAASGDRQVVSIDIQPKHAAAATEYFNSLAAGKLELLTQDSGKGLPGKTFGMLFLDGDHSYEGVRRDTAAHWPALKPYTGSRPIALYHDAVPNDGLTWRNQENHYNGVKQICEELVNSKAARVIRSAGSLLMLEKTGDFVCN